MAVSVDAISTGAVSSQGSQSAVTSLSNFINIGASATLFVFGVEADTSTPGTVAAMWDYGASNQAMTQLGTTLTETGGAEPISLALFGVVNPVSGSKEMGWSYSGQATFVGGYQFGISFTGTSIASVAAATEGFNSASGNSTSASVASGVSIATGDMAVAWFVDANGGFSGAYPNDGGTSIGENQSGASNAAAEYYSGAGSTVTSSAPLAGTDHWGALIIGVKAAAGGAAVIGLPRRVYVRRRWQGYRAPLAGAPLQRRHSALLVPQKLIIPDPGCMAAAA